MVNNEKKRLDVLIFEKGLAPSREKAKVLILGGKVSVNGKKALKPSELFFVGSCPEVEKNCFRYVSRGGLKLEKAVKSFGISLEGLVCIDVGASTGGFTDVMLRSGAGLVYAVDVGTGQLHESLKSSPKVINLEHTNIRTIDKGKIKHEIDFFSVDISFISLTLALPNLRNLVKDGACGVCLVKPQFEAGKESVGKNGVVKSSKIHEKVLCKICSFCLANGFSVLGLDYSPVKGQEGNTEYLIYIKKTGAPTIDPNLDVKRLVKSSHTKLKGKKNEFAKEDFE